MKKLLCVLCALVLLCGCSPTAQKSAEVNIVATTYPAYLAALTVTDGLAGIAVSRLDTGSVSCLHDYTLSVNDMKKIDRADVLILNGAGLEDFMSDALAITDAAVIDCSEGIDLLPATGHHDHEHAKHENDHDHGHFDPHYWMDPAHMATAVQNVKTQLLPLFAPQDAAQMEQNTETALTLLQLCRTEGAAIPADTALITFHDGFAYFAAAFALPLLDSIEEEAGSEASAKEIVRITALVKEHSLPAIFTEVNGSDATARAIARETGCAIGVLSMITAGREPTAEDPSPISPYIEAMNHNFDAVTGAFS